MPTSAGAPRNSSAASLSRWSTIAECVANAPGGPVQVLLSDVEAEHIPGCNMAFYKWALDSIGGFDPIYRKAGDDVDICWRLQQRNYRIGFCAAGFVWHYRRNTIRAYLKQQAGYGDAEALLERRHPENFNRFGGSIWRGRIYSQAKFGVETQAPIIYHGLFGSAFFQSIYATPPSLMLVVPSDHEISTVRQFWQSVEAGAAVAREGRLVVFGIRPMQPETGYGYIEVAADRNGIFDVSRFVEKPDLATAQRYVDAGNFYWNTGIFLFRASAMRDAFRAYQPAIWEAVEAAFEAATSDLSGLYMPIELYSAVPSISIDYAIMERAERIAMVPASFRWNDLGSWQSLLDIGAADENGNVIRGDVVAIDCENSYIRSEGRLLSAIGLKDVAIVSTSDATFVAPVSHSQNVKKIVEQLEKSGRLETRFTPAQDRVVESGAWRHRVQHWLFEETLPLWSTRGVDERHGGFYEALGYEVNPVLCMARKIEG